MTDLSLSGQNTYPLGKVSGHHFFMVIDKQCRLFFMHGVNKKSREHRSEWTEVGLPIYFIPSKMGPALSVFVSDTDLFNVVAGFP